jgi:aryl-alcohol dehydrogenase-like predicted oxidoreductase
MNRTFESGLSEVCYHSNIGMLAYSALAFGWLTGKYHADPKASGRITCFPGFGQRYNKPNVTVATQAYLAIAQQAGLIPAQMALAYARSRWFCSSVILGATTLGQLAENLDAQAVELGADVIEQIDEIHKRLPNPAP